MDNICSICWCWNKILEWLNQFVEYSRELDGDDIPPEAIWEAMSDL